MKGTVFNLRTVPVFLPFYQAKCFMVGDKGMLTYKKTKIFKSNKIVRFSVLESGSKDIVNNSNNYIDKN